MKVAHKTKHFNDLAPHTQKELLELYGNHMDALQAFDEATDLVEAFQVEKTGKIADAFNYVTGDLLEGCDLPFDTAYIVDMLDVDNPQISKKELDLVQIIIKKSTYRGKEAGKRMYAALVALGKPVQMVTELQMKQSQIAQDNLKLENAFSQRIEQTKADVYSVTGAWENENPQHPAVIKFKAQQAAAQGANPLTETVAETPAKAKKAKK